MAKLIVNFLSLNNKLHELYDITNLLFFLLWTTLTSFIIFRYKMTKEA